MEASDGVMRGNVESLMKLIGALERCGIELIGEGAASAGGGRGVRLKAARLSQVTSWRSQGCCGASRRCSARRRSRRSAARGRRVAQPAGLRRAARRRLRVALACGAAALLAPASRSPALTLPLGLPWIGAHFRLDALAAFFLVVVNLGGAAASLFALGYGRHEAAPARVLPFYPGVPRRHEPRGARRRCLHLPLRLGVHVAVLLGAGAWRIIASAEQCRAPATSTC